MKVLCRFILKLAGWSWSVTLPDYPKSILCVAPHTSNWDFVLGKLFYLAVGRNANFLMKKEWFFFPLNILLKAMGGIPVDRHKSTSLVEQLVISSKNNERFNLAITPEGTRKRNPNWKKGFYFIALQANMPIVLVCIDYKHKHIRMEKSVIPTGDEKKEIREIKFYYMDNAVAKHPKLFATGLEDESCPLS